MAYERRSYSGNAVATTITAGISAVDTTIVIASATGWPTTTNGPFFATLERQDSAEERVKVTARTGTTLTVTRGLDGYSAVSHAAGARIEHTYAAVEADEANAHYADTTLDHHTQYLLRSLLTGKGYIYVATSSGIIAALAPGTDFQRLRARAGATAGIEWADVVTPAEVLTSEPVVSTAFTDPTTPGPAVTLTTGTKALVFISAIVSNSSASERCLAGVAVSGATTRAASDDDGIRILGTSEVGTAAVVPLTLTAGSNTFTLKYRVTGGTGTFGRRRLAVVAY